MSGLGTLKTISLSEFLIPIYVRILLGSEPTPDAVSWMRADTCQRSGFTVATSVRRQRMVATPLLQMMVSICSDDGGNSGNGCGSGMCSRPSWAKP